MHSALVKLIQVVESFNTWVGKTASWLYPVLMLVIVFNVTMRYGFSLGSIMLEELQWHLFSAAFLMGLAYTFVEDAHVRVDIIYIQLSKRKRIWIDFLGSAFLLIPFAGFLSWD
ncbi:MAG TPA: TRAP transporter small permease subunit, partial [Alphaproteobacteria bacterium]|nr:TRAP transporter small permease subunit [Alphaproteobacteria bacterium]